MKKLLAILFLLAAPAFAQTDNGATLPQAFVASATLTTQPIFPNTAGYITKTVCASGCNYTTLATALSNIHADTGDTNGEIININQGTTLTENDTLPALTMTAGKWILIQTNPAPGALPAIGTRTSASYSGTMAVMQCNSVNTPCLVTASNANYFWIANIEFTSTQSDSSSYFIQVGNAESTNATLPNNIVIDRCYLHVQPGNTITHVIAANGNSIAVINSWMNSPKVGSQSQCVIAYNSNGPLDFENNYCDASQGIMLGAADPSIVGTNATIANDNATCGSAGICQTNSTTVTVTCTASCGAAYTTNAIVAVTSNAAACQAYVGFKTITGTTATTFTFTQNGTTGTHCGTGNTNVGGAIPSDIKVTQNNFTSPMSWFLFGRQYGGTHYSKTNAFESKNSQRLLLEGNWFHLSWGDQQIGELVILWGTNAFGACYQCTASDQVVRYNLFSDADTGIQVVGANAGSSLLSAGSWRQVIHDNLFIRLSTNIYNPGNGFAAALYVVNGSAGALPPVNLVYRHNTSFGGQTATNGQLATQRMIYFNGSTTNPLTGFIATDNLGYHGYYGIVGAGEICGNTTLNAYTTTGTVTNNVLIDFSNGGCSATNYNSYTPNWFTSNVTAMNFKSLLHNDFRLSGTDTVCGGVTCLTAATDGLQVGANIDTIMSKLSPSDVGSIFASQVSGGASYSGGAIQ